MKLYLSTDQLKINVMQLMRQAGYVYQPSRSGEDSFVRQLGRSPYPRFHVYTQEQDSKTVINLHLDQKQPGYGQQARHNAEYNGPVVTAEAQRLQTILHNG